MEVMAQELSVATGAGVPVMTEREERAETEKREAISDELQKLRKLLRENPDCINDPAIQIRIFILGLVSDPGFVS